MMTIKKIKSRLRCIQFEYTKINYREISFVTNKIQIYKLYSKNRFQSFKGTSNYYQKEILFFKRKYV